MPLIPLLLIRSCAIFMADLGAVPELVPNVLRFELAAATAVAALAIRGPAEKQRHRLLPTQFIMSSNYMFSLSYLRKFSRLSCNLLVVCVPAI